MQRYRIRINTKNSHMHMPKLALATRFRRESSCEGFCAKILSRSFACEAFCAAFTRVTS